MKMKSLFTHLPSRLYVAIAVPILLTGFGTVGYKLIGGDEWDWFDALYMSAITLTTVGYSETHPLSPLGRIFTIFFLYIGVFTLFYTASEIIRAVVSGEIRVSLGKTRMLQRLASMNSHVIICGLGRMGRFICCEFERNGVPFVIIDLNESRFNLREYQHGVPLVGDATDDEILIKAGVQRAKTLVTVLPSDADNLYITLSAHVLNDKLTIISRAEDESAEAKLRRVGADIVISPYLIGGHRVAEAVLRPTVGHFIDQATSRAMSDYQIEEITLHENSSLIGQTLASADITQKLGVVIVALKHQNASMIFNPRQDHELFLGTTLVAVGNRESLDKLENLANHVKRRR